MTETNCVLLSSTNNRGVCFESCCWTTIIKLFLCSYRTIFIVYYILFVSTNAHTHTHTHTYIYIYLLTAIGLTPCSSSTVHIYTQTIHRTTQITILVRRLSGIRTQSGQTKIKDELTAEKLSPN